MATGVKNSIPGWHIYDFFSIPVVHIDNREQFLVTFSYIFADFWQMEGGGASYLIPPLSYPPFVFVKLGLKTCWYNELDGDGGRWLYSQSWKSAKPTFCKKSAKHWRVCGRFLMCLPAIDRYRENTCEIVKIMNTIAEEHIPGSIKFNNVYARYRLDSGQTSPTIYRPLKCVNQIFF